MEDEFDYYYENDIYRLDIPDLVNMADKLDVDVEGIVMEVVRQFPNSSQEETTSAVHDSLSAAIKEKIGSRQETLESTNNKEQSFRPDPNQLKVQNELAGKSFMQASEWLIKNAPNNFSKFVAQKNHAMLKTLEAKGVILNFEVQTGQKRSLMMRNAEGVTNFTWGREGTTIKVILNGAPVTENQLGYPPGVDYDTVQHEFLHAGIRTSTKFLPLDHPVIMDLRNLFNTVVKQYNLDVKADKLPPVLMRYYKNINNVLATPDELISWGMTDKEFQKYLSTIKVGEKTVMQKIVQLVRQLLGINVTYDTALDKLVRTTDALMDIDTQVLANNMRSSNVTLGSPKMIKPLGSQQSLFSKAATRLMTDTLESRRQGFYFDAKTSPLYQTRTAEDVSFPTAAEARAAIAGNKIATNIMRERDNVKDGDYVGVRQDLNIKAAPLLSIHEGKEALHIKGAGFFTGEVQSYAPYVTLKSVFFKIRQSAREKIAQKIEQKSKMGSADGRFVKADKPNFDGVELRFNPMREHLFVDALGRAVKYADEVTLVAKRAFARGNIEYYGEEDVPARAGAAPSAAKLMELGEQITPTPDEPSGRISQNQQESLFSRNAGFFFDAKASPLYQKRTKQDVNYVDMDEAQAAVNSTEKGRRINEKNVTLKPGDYVGIRLDIPISSSTGVPVQAVHEGKASTHENGAGFYNGDVVKYLPYITLKNAYFKINQAYRAKIAAGIKKKPMGSADGIFDRIDNPNFDGVEFRFNPKREHLFVDVMGRAIKYADEITVVGNSTFARGNIEYYDASELPEAIGGFSTRAKAMEEDGQITPIPDEPKGKVSIGQQESLFSQNGYKQSMADIGAKVKGKAQQVLQNRAPADMTVFNGMSPDTIQNVNGLFFAPNKTVIDRLDDLKGNFWNTVAQKTVDQFRSIRDVSREGYMQARLSTSIDGALEGLLFYGHVFNDGGALNVRTEKNGQKLKGMIESMKPLGKDVDRFQTWMAVSREANLPADKRSTDPRMQALVNSRDEFTSGTVNGKPRMEVYEQVRKDLMALNRSVLTVAKDAGLIDKFAYDRFMADGFYIPFYKAMEDGKIESIRAASRITNQQFSKELSNKGEKPFGDLMENTLRNWSHILSASMKNQAAVTIVRDASGIGAVQPSLKVGLEWRDGKVYSVQSGDVVGNGDLVQKIVDKNGQQREVSLTESGKGTVSVQIDGLATHWHVIDPMLLESIGAITYLGPQSKIIDMMRGFKNVLRAGVTISPGFKVANLIKDSIQSIGVAGGAGEKGGLGFNAVNNILKGWASSKPGSPVYISALAGGGIFNYGSTLEGDRSKVIKKLIKQGVNSENIWDSEEKIKTGLSRLWKSYEDLGNRTESVNRALLYKNLVAQNYSHLEASFHARDLLDFSMQGSSSAVRFLSQVVPFANARLQGLYKLGRDGIIPTARVFYNSLTGKDSNLTDKQKAKAFSAVAMTTAMASMLLYLTFKDDEEFKKREQWDRDLFWWFKLPGMDFAIRIPKPFEFGAIATLAERSLEQMIDDTVESKRFTDSLSRTLFQTFSMNPMPQMFKPLYDVSTNKDAFTSAPIETAGMERLSKQERKTDMTSPLAKALGGLSHILTPESLKESEISPVQADYLIRSYFGWLGGTIETASQYAVMPFNNGVYPDADWTKRMSLGFVAKLPTQQSTYVTDFYQNNQLISQAYADMRHYAELGQAEKVQEILTEKGDLIGLEKLYDKTSKNLANIRKQVLMIQNPENISMTGEQKKEEIERLKQLISMVSEQAESIRKGMKK
jgi:hypothetical protein